MMRVIRISFPITLFFIPEKRSLVGARSKPKSRRFSLGFQGSVLDALTCPMSVSSPKVQERLCVTIVCDTK